MKLCKDCNNCKQKPGGSDWWLCTRTPTSSINPVDGSSFEETHFCIYEREKAKRCGPSGRWFQAKEAPMTLYRSHLFNLASACRKADRELEEAKTRIWELAVAAQAAADAFEKAQEPCMGCPKPDCTTCYKETP
jgi:hypothetical protein